MTRIDLPSSQARLGFRLAYAVWVAVFLTLALAPAPANAYPLWSISTIEPAYGPLDMKFDASDTPYLAYGDDGGIFFAEWDGSAWQKTVAAPHPAYCFDQVNGDISLALNSDVTKVAISFYDRCAQVYRVALGGRVPMGSWLWNIETPSGIPNDYSQDERHTSAITIDSREGNTHLVVNADLGVYYAVRAGGGWVVSEVTDDDNNSIWQDVSLVVDANGKPHVAFNSGTLLRYARSTTTGWSIEHVATGGSHSLALDGSGLARIAFNSARSLKYASRTGANAWTVTTIDTPDPADTLGDAGLYPSLVLDTAGTPHVGYHFAFSPGSSWSDIRYAFYDGAAWHVEPVALDSSPEWTSLALDSTGTPHLSYVTLSNQLRYATRDDAAGTAPDTFIDSGPPRLTNTSATFTFHSDDPAATFECRNTNQNWMACSSPYTTSATHGDGPYTFFVHAISGDITDPSPAFYTWTRDTTAPDSFIIAGPPSPSSSPDATFNFGATDASAVTFRCRVVPRVYVPGDVWPDFQSCTSPESFSGIDDGDWVFELMATDAAGNAETYHDAAFDWWTIDLPGPSTTITAKPPALTNSTTATFSFTSDNPAATFQCQIDGGAWATCASPASFTVAQGNRAFSVRATAAGQTDPIPATYSWTVDTTPPMATIDTHPPLNDQLTTATFTFHSNDAAATFQCRLNSSNYATCATPKTYTDLAGGNYTFYVRAVDAAGNVSPTPAHYAWYTAGPPQTSIYYPDPLPVYTTSTSISFLAASNKTASTYECKLDGAGFAACANGNGQSYSNLTPGTHTFAVRATDSYGQPDPTPAVHTWVIDPYWPDTQIDGRPADPSNSAAPRLLFSSGSPGATFECRLDGGAWGACANPKDYSGLANGSHTFEVRATSGAGIVDPTPAGYTWTIALAADTTAPDTTLTQQPANPTNQARATYAFASDDAAATFECSSSGASFAPCVSPVTYTGTYGRELPFAVRARDDKGNVDASPADSFALVQLDQEPGALALGQAHACALRPNGSVDCWGSNSNGQAVGQPGPFTAIAANDYATCGLRPDGSAHCWGHASYGGSDQVGPFTQISGGAYSFCGVKTDNSIACWGWNANGQAANQSGPFTLVSGGTAHTCALSADGTITCWGANSSGQLAAPAGAFDRLVSGYQHSCAMNADSSVDCWGYGAYGQNADQAGPYVQLTAGNDHNCALQADGSVVCWGRNDYGQATDQAGPYVTLAAGGHFTCALGADGRVDCWGINPDGRADDQAGPFGPTVFDTFAPDTLIDSGPAANTEASDAAFTFRGNEYGVTFECALDGAAYAACVSPQSYAGLATGAHTFQVRANDAAGHVDASPAEHAWTINAIEPPETTLLTAPAALTNSATATFTFSSSESGSTFECKMDSGSFAACTSPQGYTGLADGSHTFAVKAIDSGGTADPTPAGHTWTIDTSAADTTLTTTPPNPSTSSDATFAFSSEADATFECKLDSAAFAACASPQSYTGLSDGSHTFQVRARDAAGNADASPATYTWALDATPPDTTITGQPDATTGSTTANFAFTGVDATSFECQLDAAAFAACTSPQSYTGLSSGSHTFLVRARDAEGRYDPTPAGYTWTVDATAPETTITTRPTDPSNDATPDFAFSSDDPGAYFYCQTDANGWFPCGGSSITYYNLDEGYHSFYVKAEDAEGNVDPTPATWSWTIDLTAPQTTITAEPPATSASAAAAFEFTSSETGPFECRLDSAAYAACASPQNYTGLSDGIHIFAVWASDAAGNSDPSPATYAWTIDTAGPATTINSGPSGITGDNTPSFAFTSEDGATFECQLNGGDWLPCASPHECGVQPDGDHTFRVRATDAAGNTGAVATRSFTVDSAAPSVTIDTHPPALTNSNDPTFTFSGEVGATLTCQLDGGAFAGCDSPQGYTNLTDGEHTFTVRATDSAGNSAEAVYTWTIDTVAPTVTIISAPPDPSDSPDATLAFLSETGATFECRLDGSAWASCTSPENYSGLSDGSHTFEVRGSDAAGNTGAADSHTWTIDLPPVGAVYVTAGGGSVPGAGAYQKNDILKWDGSAWSVWFDGAAEGLPGAADIMAFDVADDETGAAWLAVRQAVKLPVVGKVQPTQIVYTNGATTWSLFFDGGDVGLKTTGERINGLEVLPGSASPLGAGCQYYLLISTVAGGGVPVGATNVNFTGEDVLGFCMTQSGANTAGLWHIAFEGESQGLQKNNNLGLSASDDAATLYFTAKKSFTGDGGLVRPSQLFSFSNGVFSGPLWTAADHGLMQVIDGIDLVGDVPQE
jgi:alpha-tubulin suppressor-like RCC1 family protein